MTNPVMTEAEMTRAVARGVQQAKRRAELRKTMIGVCGVLVIVLLFVLEGFVARVLPGNTTVANVAAVAAIVLPWAVFWKTLV